MLVLQIINGVSGWFQKHTSRIDFFLLNLFWTIVIAMIEYMLTENWGRKKEAYN